MYKHQIVLWNQTLLEHRGECVCVPLFLHCWDDGTCYTEVNMKNSTSGVRGFLHICCGHFPEDVSALKMEDVQVHVFAGWEDYSPSQPAVVSSNLKIKGYVRQKMNL